MLEELPKAHEHTADFDEIVLIVEQLTHKFVLRYTIEELLLSLLCLVVRTSKVGSSTSLVGSSSFLFNLQ